jgi:hypothetical protein
MYEHRSPDEITGSHRTQSGLEVVMHRRDLSDAELPPDKMARLERSDSTISGLVMGINTINPEHLVLYAVEVRMRIHRQLVAYALENLPTYTDGTEDTRALVETPIHTIEGDIRDARIGARYMIDLTSRTAVINTFYGEDYGWEGQEIAAGITGAFAQTLRASGQANKLEPELLSGEYTGGLAQSLPTMYM